MPGSHRSRRAAAAAGAAALLVGLAACGDDEPASGGSQERGCAVLDGDEVTIVAKDIAWDVDCLQVPAGVAFTVVVDNQDPDVNHDFQLALDDGTLSTPLEAGPVVQRLEVPALEVGRHAYVCEIHPNMTGTLEVLESGPEGEAARARVGSPALSVLGTPN